MPCDLKSAEIECIFIMNFCMQVSDFMLNRFFSAKFKPKPHRLHNGEKRAIIYGPFGSNAGKSQLPVLAFCENLAV